VLRRRRTPAWSPNTPQPQPRPVHRISAGVTRRRPTVRLDPCRYPRGHFLTSAAGGADGLFQGVVLAACTGCSPLRTRPAGWGWGCGAPQRTAGRPSCSPPMSGCRYCARGQGMPVVGGRLSALLDGDASGRRPPWAPRGPTQLRSVPLAGGRMQVRTVPGCGPCPGGRGWLPSWTPARYDLDRDVTTAVVVPPGYRKVSCGWAWCLAFGGQPVRNWFDRTGSDPRALGGADTQSATRDAVLLERYTLVLVPAGAGQRLVLYDIAARRSVLVAPAVTGAGSDGPVPVVVHQRPRGAALVRPGPGKPAIARGTGMTASGARGVRVRRRRGWSGRCRRGRPAQRSSAGRTRR
jgi:hypothetical protein